MMRAVLSLLLVAAAPDPIGAIDTALTAGRLDQARMLIERSAAGGETAALALRRAEHLLASGRTAAAAQAFAALQATPEVAARAAQGLGIARLQSDDTPGAIVALDAAVAADPALARAWTARGVAADRTQDWPRAAAAYDRALALTPASTAALVNRGYSRLQQRDAAGAEADLTAALRLEPGSSVAAGHLVLARALQGRYDAAFTGRGKATLPRDLNTVGYAAMMRGDHARAETYFSRALELNPAFDRIAWANLQYVRELARAASPAAALQP